MAKKVLMIDDDADFVESIVNLLEAKGYNVDFASNGKDGVDKAKASIPDIILLDVMMTTRDEGFNVARQLKQIDDLKGTPIIMISGVRKEMSLPFGFEPNDEWLPIKKFLEKPVKPDDLLEAVAEFI